MAALLRPMLTRFLARESKGIAINEAAATAIPGRLRAGCPLPAKIARFGQFSGPAGDAQANLILNIRLQGGGFFTGGEKGIHFRYTFRPPAFFAALGLGWSAAMRSPLRAKVRKMIDERKKAAKR
jgi:hypothetical protein